jgi:hypothetical protein
MFEPQTEAVKTFFAAGVTDSVTAESHTNVDDLDALKCFGAYFVIFLNGQENKKAAQCGFGEFEFARPLTPTR